MRLKAHKPEAHSDQSGAVYIEAALALPIFLGITFVTILLLLFCYRIVSFQYAMAEATRETFSRDSTGRNSQTWQQYWLAELGARTSGLGLVTRDLYGRDLSSAQVTFTNNSCSSGWNCSQFAEPGDIFSVTLTLTVPVFPQSVGGVSLPQIEFSSRSIAAIHIRESE